MHWYSYFAFIQLNIIICFQHVCTFSYLPLKVGETSGKIEFTSNDLGTYTYEVNLKATAAGPEKALYFHCCLGQNQVSVAKFLNFSKQTKPDYACRVRNKIYFNSHLYLFIDNLQIWCDLKVKKTCIMPTITLWGLQS
jgi:hypothetical protein